MSVDESLPRSISQRKRMVVRARKLKDDDQFVRELYVARGEWNERFKAWPVRGQDPPPEIVHWIGSNIPPPSLAAEYSKGLAELGPEKFGVPPSFDHDPKTSRAERLKHLSPWQKLKAAIDAWNGLTNRIAAMFFAPSYFPPSWRFAHPAQPFIALCLRYDRKFVPEHSMRAFGLVPDAVGRHPRDLQLACRVALQHLEDAEEGIGSAVDGELRGLTSTEVSSLAQQLRQILRIETGAAGRTLNGLDPFRADDFHYLPLPIDLTPADIRGSADVVDEYLQVVTKGGFKRLRSWELRAEGLNNEEAEFVSGISDSAVSEYLQGLPPKRPFRSVARFLGISDEFAMRFEDEFQKSQFSGTRKSRKTGTRSRTKPPLSPRKQRKHDESGAG